MSNNNNSFSAAEIRLEIEPEDVDSIDTHPNPTSIQTQQQRSTLSTIFSNNQQIINNVLAQIDHRSFDERINTFLEQQQPTSPTHQHRTSPRTFNREIPADDQNDEQYIVIWITILRTLIQYIPILLILLLKCTFENVQVIVVILLLHSWTWYLNSKFKVEVAKKTQRSKARLAVLILYILALIHCLVIFLIGDTMLGLLLIYSETNVTLSQLLYQVILTDCVLKLVSILLKVLITIIPLHWIHFKQRSRSYAFIENLSQLYRCLAPVHIWLDHFFFAYSGWRIIFGGLFSALYLGYKGFDVNRKLKPVTKSFLALYRNVVSFIYY